MAMCWGRWLGNRDEEQRRWDAQWCATVQREDRGG
jgi:hypothetical protein